MNQNVNQDMGLALTFLILLILSAFDKTSKIAIWIGLFMLGVVWISTYQTGQLQALGKQLFTSGGNPNQ